MRWALLFLVLVMSVVSLPSYSQSASPEDVFLEVPSAAPPPTEHVVEDLPPNEPPYTQTPDELEAQNMLHSEPVPKPTSEPKALPRTQGQQASKVVESEETAGQSGRKKIAHPDAKKGLYLIDQNTGRYYYKTQKISQKNQSTSIRFGTITYPNIDIDTGAGTPITFGDIYGENDLSYLMMDYEWQPFRSFGKLGVVFGLGFFTAHGNGRFADPNVKGGAPAREGFTLIGLPVSAGGIYRLEFWDKQWIAPFVVGGMSYYVLGEIRDDNKAPKFVGTPAGYAGGGALFNITAWSKEIDFVMDREYGINNMWLYAEFRTVQSLNEDLDVSSDIFNIGIAVDY